MPAVRLYANRDGTRLRLSLPREPWRALKSACLGSDPGTCFAGGRNAFELERQQDQTGSKIDPIQLDFWTGASQTLKFGVDASAICGVP